jgi:hypothetical protein
MVTKNDSGHGNHTFLYRTLAVLGPLTACVLMTAACGRTGLPARLAKTRRGRAIGLGTFIPQRGNNRTQSSRVSDLTWITAKREVNLSG